jgi:hypothetical protein
VLAAAFARWRVDPGPHLRSSAIDAPLGGPATTGARILGAMPILADLPRRRDNKMRHPARFLPFRPERCAVACFCAHQERENRRRELRRRVQTPAKRRLSPLHQIVGSAGSRGVCVGILHRGRDQIGVNCSPEQLLHHRTALRVVGLLHRWTAGE